jgi:TonB family protein
MKIVCDACQAKYSISDDKVQGKVFKIRCKKCSNIIVVRGGATATEPAPPPAQEKDTRVYDYGYEGGGDQPPAGDESVWHVVINQDQVGPMTAVEVQQRFAAGEIDGETYAWREGFADWLPLAQVDTFAAFVASGSTTTAAAGGGGADAVAAMFSSGEELGTTRSDPGDLFASASASARHSADDDGADLFGSSKPSSASSQSAAQQQAAAAKLRGERNENSVLFSLNNLAQLASDKPAAASAPSSSTMQGHATGAAGGEGSGLIDIRSMANAYLGGGGGAVKPSTSSAIGSIDDLPVFGGGGFSEPAVIVPTARASAASSKMMYALIGSVALLAIVGVILVVIVLKKDDKKADTLASSATTSDKAADSAKKSDDTVAAKPDENKPDETAAAKPDETKPADTATKPDDKKPEEATAKKPDEKKPATTKRDQPRTVANTRPRETTRPKDPPKKDEPAAGGCDDVGCIINNYEGACCAKYRKGGASKPAGGGVQIGEKPKSGLPDALDRGMISAGLGPVKGAANACGSRSAKKGTVRVSVRVNANGSIASVTVKEQPDSVLGSCVQSAIQRARFQATASGGSFNYPVVFN